MANSYKDGDTGQRPWGQWTVIGVGDKYTVKKITVNPAGRLSLQYHKHRDEVWAIISGGGEIQIGDDTRPVNAGDTAIIPKETPHRISNTGNVPLVFIETQIGDILDEQDIIRIQDDYCRLTGKSIF
jgi:mannose-6-phosphate isomerase-like protein (cupin superfamily)